MRRLPAITCFLIALAALPAGARAAGACAIPGDAVQWQADYCLYVTGTDDIVAAQPCIEVEMARTFPDACAAKRHYKRLLCGFAVRDGWARGTLAQCLDDASFHGTTVGNGSD